MTSNVIADFIANTHGMNRPPIVRKEKKDSQIVALLRWISLTIAQVVIWEYQPFVGLFPHLRHFFGDGSFRTHVDYFFKPAIIHPV